MKNSRPSLPVRLLRVWKPALRRLLAAAALRLPIFKPFPIPLLLAGLFALGAARCVADSYVWNGGSGDWSVAANWTPNGVPGAADSATINSGTASINTDTTVSNLTFMGGTIAGTALFTVSSNLAWTGGTMDGGGTTRVALGAVGTVSGTIDKVLLGPRRFENAGTVTWLDGDIRIEAFGGRWVNLAGALWDIQCDRNIFGICGGEMAVENHGLMRKSAGAGQTGVPGYFCSFGAAAFMNTGTVEVQTGTLVIQGQETTRTHAGTLQVAANAAVNFTGGGQVVTGTLLGPGLVRINGASVLVNAPQTFPLLTVTAGSFAANTNVAVEQLTFNGGTIAGTGLLTVASNLTWTAGTMSDGGTTRVALGAVGTVSGAGDKYLLGPRRFENAGTVTWLDGDIRIEAFGGRWVNLAGALWDIQCDRNVFGICGGEMAVENHGLMRKSAGIGQTGVPGNFCSFGAAAFMNAGTVDVQTGTLVIKGQETTRAHTGTFSVSNTATLDFLGGGQVLNPGSAFSGAGTVRFRTTITLGMNLNFGALQVLFQDNASVSGAFILANTSGGTMTFNKTMTVPGCVDIGGTMAVGSSSHTVTINCKLALESGATLNNPGTVRVGRFDNFGGSVNGNAPVLGTPLQISPASTTVGAAQSATFTASGGTPGYTFSLSGNNSGGSITINGAYTAGPTTGVSDTILVSDSAGCTATATVSVTAPPLQIVPASTNVTPGTVVTFTATGGTPPYVFANVNITSSGSINATGLYTAGLMAGTDTVRALDNAGHSATGMVVVVCGPLSGLVGWWRGEGNGLDSVNGNQITLSGGAGYTAGQVGQAFQFDGVDDSGRINAAPALNVGTGAGLTLSAWINPSDGAGSHTLFEWNDPVRSYGVHFYQSGDTLYANVAAPGNVNHGFSSTNGVIVTGHWQHVALTYDRASGTGTMYCDSVVVAQSVLGSYTPETSFDLYFGKRQTGDGPYWYQGGLDDLRLYNHALSAAEIQAYVTCVVPPLQIAPASTNVAAGATVAFAASGGTPPYRFDFTAQPSGGTIASNGVNTALYSAGLTAGTDTVRLRDVLDNAVTATVVVTYPLHTNGHYYRFVTNGLTWLQARDAAAAQVYFGLRGHLATINDAAEQSFIVSNFATNFPTNFFVTPVWIGGFQPACNAEPAGGWNWVTGEAFTYSNWNADEPNNDKGVDESAMDIRQDGFWNDELGTIIGKGYVVEFEPPFPLRLSPPSTNVPSGEMQTFTALGGVPPYTNVFVQNNSGAGFNTSNGVYTAGAAVGALDTLRVTDSLLSNATATATVLPVPGLLDGLIGYWRLDTVSGGITPDSTTNGNHLNLTNMDAGNLIPGMRGNAMTFNGTDELLTLTYGAGNVLPAYKYPAYSLAMWVKGASNQLDRRVFAETSRTNTVPLATLGTDTAGTSGKLDFHRRSDGNFNLINHLKSTNTMFDNTWHHLVVVDNKGLVQFYIDGVLDSASSYGRGTLTLNTLAIGAMQRATNSAWFSGLIDDVALWRRALRPNEIPCILANGANLGPVLTQQPASLTAECGGPSQFTVTATSYDTIRYQWYRGATPLAGQTTATLTVTASAVTAGSYSVVLTNCAGAVTSAVAVLTVQDTTPPSIAMCVTNQTLTAGPNNQTTLPDLRGQLSASDNCSAVTVAQSPPVGTVRDLGMHTVTFFVSDSAGNTSSCSAMVTVVVGAATQLAFVTQPSTTVALASMTPSVRVEVRDASGNLVSNATSAVSLALQSNPGGATLTGGGAASAVNGVATFAGLSLDQPGNGYTLRATSPGLSDVTSTPFNISSPPFLAVSGRLTDAGSGAGLRGFTMTLSSPGGTRTKFTDTEGRYSFSSVPSGQTHTLTPSFNGFTFAPASETFTLGLSNQVHNFTATQTKFTISGVVTEAGGVAISAAAVVSTGSATGTYATDAAGAYTSPLLASGGHYTLSVTRPGYTFSPSQTIGSLTSNTTMNFTGAPVQRTISGVVTNPAGAGVAGVIVSVVRSASGVSTNVTTDGQGRYTVSNLPPAANYTVAPAIGVTPPIPTSFTPGSIRVSVQQGDRTASFLAVRSFTVSGRIADGSANVTNVLLLVTNVATGARVATTLTAGNGNPNYTTLPLREGATYLITPSLAGYTFTPPNRTVMSLAANATGVGFTGTKITRVAISGVVTNGAGFGLPYVRVALSGGASLSTTTSVSGEFVFANLQGGQNYALTFSRSNLVMAPASVPLTAVAADTQVNAKGTPLLPLTGRIVGLTISPSAGPRSFPVLMNADGSARVELWKLPGVPTSGSLNVLKITLSPDGRKIAFVNGWSYFELWVMNSDATGLRLIAPSRVPIDSLNWAPDSSRLAYTVPTSSDVGVHIVNADGTGNVVVPGTRGAGYLTPSGADWSPDGQSLVMGMNIGSHALDYDTQITTIGTDGSNPVLIGTAWAGFPRLAWKPSSRIAFADGPVGGNAFDQQIVTMLADGFDRRQVTSPPTSIGLDAFTWSPDGSMLAYGSLVSGKTITAMIPDGSLQTPIGEGSAPSWSLLPSVNTPGGQPVGVALGGSTVSFSNVTVPGSTSIIPVPAPSQSAMPAGYFSVPGASMSLEVTTTAVRSGPITVCFTVLSNLTQTAFNNLRVLHAENGILFDRTILTGPNGPNFSNKTICAQVSSLSPFYIAQLADPGLALISGAVIDADGNPRAGVLLSANTSNVLDTVTDSEGRFAFPNLTPGLSYVITPLDVDSDFTPAVVLLSPLAGENTLVFVSAPRSGPPLTIVPDLAIPGRYTISWEAASDAYVLEATATLSAPNWIAAPEAVSSVGEVNTLSIQASETSRYFRLRKQ